MTNKNKIKIALDICMIFLFITFFDKNFVNMKFHMLSGIIFAVFILIHMFIYLVGPFSQLFNTYTCPHIFHIFLHNDFVRD